LFLVLISFASCSSRSGISRVWAVDDGEKIRKDDISNPLASDPANAVWANNTVNIFGGRNEIVAFQLIIQGEKTGASEVNVKISDLQNGTSVIPGSSAGPSDPFDYRGRHIELFTEHYLNMVKRSPPDGFFQRPLYRRHIIPAGYRIALSHSQRLREKEELHSLLSRI